MQERLELSIDRIREIGLESKLQKEYQSYFEKVAEFLLMIEENRQWILEGNLLTASVEELRMFFREIMKQAMPIHSMRSVCLERRWDNFLQLFMQK